MLNSSPIKVIAVPDLLKQIPDPPMQLYHVGKPLESLLKKPRVAIVGTRQITPYGQRVTEEITKKLVQRGIVIISGLALGTDTATHEACLQAAGQTIAVLPGTLEDIMPPTNRPLAEKILQQGGALISEYSPGYTAGKYGFVARNRIVSGLADAVLIVEAGNPSGSLRTSDFANDQGKTIMAVPGNITSPVSAGTNKIIREGAVPITSYLDVLEVLEMDGAVLPEPTIKGATEQEQILLDLLYKGFSKNEQLLKESGLPVASFNQAITMLEIVGKIRQVGLGSWAINSS